MNVLRLSVFLILTVTCTGQPLPAADPPPKEMERFEVKAAPFGYLGIKRATIFMSFFRLVTFRNPVRFVEIDEIYPESPAASAGIKTRDRVTGLNGTPITQWSAGRLKQFGETVEVG